MMRRSTVCSVCGTVPPTYMRQFRMRFGRCQLGQDPNRASLFPGVKYWEIIADNLSKAGWSWGCVSAVNSPGEYKARQIVAENVKASSITSSDVSTYLRHG